MALSSRNARLALLSALSACGAWAVQVLAAALPAHPVPITVDAASSEVDYRTNMVVFSQVVISQGAMRVQADHAHASGLNFANSRWTFDGHVRIDAEPRGSLRSDQAIVEFRDNRILRATANGKPAEFEQPRGDSQQMARGHADEIVYDVSQVGQNRYRATGSVVQSSHGIKPYTGFFGALKVRDAVDFEVEADVRTPDGPG